MAISVGDKVPDVKLMTMTAEGPRPVQSGEVLGSGKVVLFAVPGAFTPTCSDHHLPGFVLRADDLVPAWPSAGWLVLLALTSQVLGWLLITVSLPRLPAAMTSMILTIQPIGSVGNGVNHSWRWT